VEANYENSSYSINTISNNRHNGCCLGHNKNPGFYNNNNIYMEEIKMKYPTFPMFISIAPAIEIFTFGTFYILTIILVVYYLKTKNAKRRLNNGKMALGNVNTTNNR
jgi:hypothetical protein